MYTSIYQYHCQQNRRRAWYYHQLLQCWYRFESLIFTPSNISLAIVTIVSLFLSHVKHETFSSEGLTLICPCGYLQILVNFKLSWSARSHSRLYKTLSTVDSDAGVPVISNLWQAWAFVTLRFSGWTPISFLSSEDDNLVVFLQTFIKWWHIRRTCICNCLTWWPWDLQLFKDVFKRPSQLVQITMAFTHDECM